MCCFSCSWVPPFSAFSRRPLPTSFATPRPRALRCFCEKRRARWSWKSAITDGAFPKRRSPTPGRSACAACANARPCWAARWTFTDGRAKAQRSRSAFRYAPRGRARNAFMKILIVDDHAMVREGLRHVLADTFRKAEFGEAGYMNKESAAGELVGAVKKILAGGRYVSPALAEKMALYLDVDVKRPLHERLSDREFQIMRLIAAGQTVREIAERNFLSGKTVRTYRERILQKMGLKRNADLTRYAIENRLVRS